jgi:hypothetical protein
MQQHRVDDNAIGVAPLLSAGRECGACGGALSSSRRFGDARSACVLASMREALARANECIAFETTTRCAHRENSSVSLRDETPQHDLRLQIRPKRRNPNARHFSPV